MDKSKSKIEYLRSNQIKRKPILAFKHIRNKNLTNNFENEHGAHFKYLDLYEKLTKLGVSVLFDDRKEVSIGAKIKDSKMVGCPYMAVLGKSMDNGYIEVENNKNLHHSKMNISYKL